VGKSNLELGAFFFFSFFFTHTAFCIISVWHLAFDSSLDTLPSFPCISFGWVQ
jgi:hypothetical protein